MSTRLELTLRGDPLLKNELLKAAGAGLFSKRNPLKAAQMFIRNLLDERDTWEVQARVQCRSARNRGVTPVQTPCTVAWTHLRANGGVVDTAAIAYPTWGILDGVVRGGMLPDDSFRHVTLQTYGVEVAGYEGIRLVVETVPDAADSSSSPRVR
jgi:hypothetical protein